MQPEAAGRDVRTVTCSNNSLDCAFAEGLREVYNSQLRAQLPRFAPQHMLAWDSLHLSSFRLLYKHEEVRVQGTNARGGHSRTGGAQASAEPHLQALAPGFRCKHVYVCCRISQISASDMVFALLGLLTDAKPKEKSWHRAAFK